MEEIRIKPLIKPGLISILLILGILLVFFIIGGIIFGPLFFIAILFLPVIGAFMVVGVLLSNLPVTYIITQDNEIIIEYSFLNKSTQVYRMDQITTLSYRKGFVGKLFNMGTINFGIFGKSNVIGSPSGDKGAALQQTALRDIKFPEEIFEKLLKIQGVSLENKLISQKPKVSPFLLRSSFLVLVIFIIGLGLSILTEIFVLMFAFGALGLLTILGIIVGIFRYKKTKYEIYGKSVVRSHNYLFSKTIHVTPLNKITNIDTYKGIFSYLLFKVQSMKIYTGGSQDVFFSDMINVEQFSNLLSKTLKNSKSQLTQKDVENIEIKKAEFVEKPGISYIFTYLVTHLILLGLLLVISYLIPVEYIPSEIKFFIVLGVASVLLLSIILNFIIWKNITYEFYDEKIISYKGVFKITRKEIQIRNIKYVKYDQSFPIQRLFSQGTIHIHTAGTGLKDNVLESINDPIKYYEALVGYLKENK